MGDLNYVSDDPRLPRMGRAMIQMERNRAASAGRKVNGPRFTRTERRR